MDIFGSSPKEKKSSAESTPPGTVIGFGIECKGTLQGNKDTICVKGIFEGDIETLGDIEISDTGMVIGKVSAENLEVTGTFKGILAARGCLSIHKGGIVVADTKMTRVVIDEGGTLSGKSEMTIPAIDMPIPQE